MKSMIKPVFSLMVAGVVSFSCAVIAEPAKCSPCQAAKSIRDEIKQSIKDAAAAVLAAGGAYSREQELDIDASESVKCGCSRTTRDEISQVIEKCGCNKPRTTRDEFARAIEPGEALSIVEAAQAALETVQALMEAQLDEIPNVSRAPREEFANPCNPCEENGCELNPCGVNAQLKAIRCCCASLTQRVACHGNNARKFYKKLKNKIDDVEELVESVIDQVAVDASITDSALLSIIAEIEANASVTDALLLSIIDILTLAP